MLPLLTMRESYMIHLARATNVASISTCIHHSLPMFRRSKHHEFAKYTSMLFSRGKEFIYDDYDRYLDYMFTDISTSREGDQDHV